MKIAFILDHNLMHYRIPFFNLLQAKGFEITVMHTGKNIDNTKFKQINLKKISLGPFFYRKTPRLDTYDIVVYMQNIRYIDFILSCLNIVRKYKLVHWGIGVSSSNGLTAERGLIAKFRSSLENYADAIVYYSRFPLQFVKKKNKRKVYIANNTIENPLKVDCSQFNKDSFLFIGSLDNRKGLDLLVAGFREYIQSQSNPVINKLFIIGDGNERDNIKKNIQKYQLEDSIILPGKIMTFEAKLPYFQRSIMTISPKQAGLSVLESFSFGVPFMTYKNAISGGEHLNIIHKENGLLLNNVSASTISNELKQINASIESFRKLGHNAFQFYNNERSMEKMAQSFVDCFNQL